MGKRKNRHCQSKQEVLQRAWQQEANRKKKTTLKGRLQMINSIKHSVDQAKEQEKDRRKNESYNI